MLLERLTLRNFRNIEHCDLELGSRFTVLFGHNGAGKTALLEAVYLVSTLRSFRTSDLAALVRYETDGAAVELRARDLELELDTTLEVRLVRRGTTTRKTAIADGKTVRSAAEFYGRVRAVLFTPEDLAVLRGSPSARRQFLDRMLFARQRAHIADVQAYEKLVRSRNQVLKGDALDARQRDDLLATYETGLAEVGARVWTRRTDLLAELAAPFSEAFAQIHGHVGPFPQAADARPLHATVAYRSPLGDIERSARADALQQALAQRRRDDLRRGMTTVGPHRDDLVVELDGQPAADFASQGQTRALVLGFKLAEVRVAHRVTNKRPLLLLDDVSSELDPDRTALLFETLGRDVGQCVLTTTAPHHIALPADAPASAWRVDRGVVRRAES